MINISENGVLRISVLCFRTIMLISMLSSIFRQRWDHFFTALIALTASFVPSILRSFLKKRNVEVPANFDVVYLLFLFSTLYLGDINRFYDRYFWWDKAIHVASGVIFVIVGFYIVRMLNLKRSGYLITNVYIIILFSIGLALTAGVLWEIFEFICDYFFNTDMQQSGLVDTMLDLMLDILGALTASIYYYFRHRKHSSLSN